MTLTHACGERLDTIEDWAERDARVEAPTVEPHATRRGTAAAVPRPSLAHGAEALA